MTVNLLDYDDMVRHWCYKLGARSPVEDSDEYGDGWVGLVEAVRKFDPTRINPRTNKPYEFSTYAYVSIRNAIRKREHLRRAAKRGGSGLGNCTQPMIRTAEFSFLDDLINSDGEDSFSSSLAVAPKEPDLSDKELIETLLSRIDSRRAQAVRLFVMEGKTLREAAVSLGVSHTRAGHLCSDGIQMLKRAAETLR